MLRDLQSIITNVDAQNRVAVEMVRGTFVNKDVAKRELVLPTNQDELYIVDRDHKVTAEMAMGLPIIAYDKEQETIKEGEFAIAIPLLIGVRKATSEFEGQDADLEAGKYLKAGDKGKLVKSDDATRIKSIGFINDNGHKLLGFEIVK